MKKLAVFPLALALVLSGLLSVYAAAADVDGAEAETRSVMAVTQERELVVDVDMIPDPEVRLEDVGGVPVDAQGQEAPMIGDQLILVGYKELPEDATEQMQRDFEYLSGITAEAEKYLTVLNVNSALFGAPVDIREELMEKAADNEISDTAPTRMVSSTYPVRTWLPINDATMGALLTAFLFDENDNWYVPEGMEIIDLRDLLSPEARARLNNDKPLYVVSFILDRPAHVSLAYLRGPLAELSESEYTEVHEENNTVTEPVVVQEPIPAEPEPLPPAPVAADSPEQAVVQGAEVQQEEKLVTSVTVISASVPGGGSLNGLMIDEEDGERAALDGEPILVDLDKLSDHATEQMTQDFDELAERLEEAGEDLVPDNVNTYISRAPQSVRNDLREKSAGNEIVITAPTRIVANVYPVRAWIPIDAENVDDFLTVFLHNEEGAWYVPRDMEVVDIRELLSEAELAELAEQQGFDIHKPIYVIRFILDGPSRISFVYLNTETAP